MSEAALKTITKKYGNILVNGAQVFEDLKDMIFKKSLKNIAITPKTS